jgi:diguanylate cyclase (GGDEF)-like protein
MTGSSRRWAGPSATTIKVAVLFVDLDDFNAVNDSLGHAIGDTVLQSLAKRLLQALRHTDTVCRQGGGEFVILLSEINNAKDADLVAKQLVAALTAPHIFGSRELRVTASIGIGIYPEHSQDAESLVHC